MADIGAKWTENQTVSFDNTTPAKTVEGKGDIDLDANGFIAVAIQFQIIFGANADGNAEIRVRNSSDSGSAVDTILLWSQEVTYDAGETKRITVVIRDVPFIEVGIYNGNSAVEDITISAKYAGKKLESV